MTETTSTGLVQQFIRQTERLYSLPAVAMEALRLASEPHVDAVALKQCIERDPALTARILRVVNSSLFAASRQVTDLNQALSLLGTRPLKMLVLGFSLPKELFTGIEADVLARYWRRTLTKAAAARELAQRLWRLSGDDAFTAGLVQDIGVLVLVQQLGEPYLHLLDHVQVHGGNLLERELDSLGFDHRVLGARLLAHWGLPAGLCAAVAVPPNLERVEALEPADRTLPQILHLAELLARMLEQPYGTALRDLLAAGAKYRGLTYEGLRPIVAVLQRQVTELADVLSLELPEQQSYADLLIAAQERLANETACATAELLSADPEAELFQLANRLRGELQGASSGRTTVMMRPRPAEPTPPVATASRPEERPAAASRTSAAVLEMPRVSTAAGPRQIDATADSVLVGMVGSAIQRCRQLRCSISLALFAIDHYSDLLLQLGPTRASDLVHGLRIGLTDWTGHRAMASLAGDSCYALLWEDCSRSDAVQLVRQALEAAKSRRTLKVAADITLSAGLATLEVPPRNYPPHQLIDAAQRCLNAAQLSGGDSLKSIAF